MSTTPNDEDRTHNESPAEGETSAAESDSGREHSQNAAEGEEDQA